MIYVLLFILGLIIGALLIPFVIYFRARRTGWDDSNIFNVFRVICHLALHPEDFLRMRYEDGKNPFWYLTKDEFSEVVDSRPNNHAGYDYETADIAWPGEENPSQEKDLEIATDIYANMKYGCNKVSDAFRAGAQWQKEQILKNAIEEEVFDGSFAEQIGELPVVQYAITPDDKLKIGDKVKLLIIKKN